MDATQGAKPRAHGPQRYRLRSADDGEDKSATAHKESGVFIGVDDWHSDKDQLVQNAKKVYADANASGALISYDTIGVGAFVGGYVDEQTS